MSAFSDWFLLIFFEEIPRNIKTFKKLQKEVEFLCKESLKTRGVFCVYFFFFFFSAHNVLKFKNLLWLFYQTFISAVAAVI